MLGSLLLSLPPKCHYELWNLVPAHMQCNSTKNSRVGSAGLLERLVIGSFAVEWIVLLALGKRASNLREPLTQLL